MDTLYRLANMHRERGKEVEIPKDRICLPYVSGLSVGMKRILRRFDVGTACASVSSLGQQLTRVKDVDPSLSKVGVAYVQGSLQLWEGIH